MGAPIFQPLGKIKLTNVSVVRLKKNGKVFEVAAYKNKITEFRNNLEKDIDNVIQTAKIFSNVSRGALCNKKDLSVFGNMKEEEVIKEILLHGEIRISTQERAKELEAKRLDIAGRIAEMSICTTTNQPCTVSMILNAIKSEHLPIDLFKSAQKQADDILDVFESNQNVPIKRTSIEVEIEFPEEHLQKALPSIESFLEIKHSSVMPNKRWVAAASIFSGKLQELYKVIGGITQDYTVKVVSKEQTA